MNASPAGNALLDELAPESVDSREDDDVNFATYECRDLANQCPLVCPLSYAFRIEIRGGAAQVHE